MEIQEISHVRRAHLQMEMPGAREKPKANWAHSHMTGWSEQT